jgi:ketosteroid isomerase-like protein
MTLHIIPAHTRRATFANFCILLLSLTSLLTRLSTASAASPQAEAITNIARIRETWTQYLHNKQLEPILNLYTADACFLQPTGERIAGQPALRTLFTTIMATFHSDLTLHTQSVEISSDLAYDSGDYQETLTTISTGVKASYSGSYLMVFKRGRGGEWKIVQHVFTGATVPEVPKATK